MHPGEKLFLEQRVYEALRTVFDPEIPVNIYDLGLIYEVEIGEAGEVVVRMTLTTRDCPAARSLPGDVERKVRDVEGVAAATVELIWEPPWRPSRISEAARHQLGLN